MSGNLRSLLKVFVQRFANQWMSETADIARRARDYPDLRGLPHRLGNRVAAQFIDPCKQSKLELLPDHRSLREHVAHFFREHSEPTRDRGSHVVRQLKFS